MEQKEALDEFTKSTMISYAGLLKEIAREYMPDEQENGSCIETREGLFARKEREENKRAFSRFVLDTSQQFERLAKMGCADSILVRKQEKRIRRELRSAGIELKEFYRRENRNGYQEIGMVVRTVGQAFYDVEEIADLLSQVTRVQMLPIREGYQYIHSDFVPLCFQEEVNFRVFGGFARATKEGEELSGDNYVMREYGDGTYLAGISDGMGSGREASMDSEKILELVEKHVESRLSVRSALRLGGELLYIRYAGERSVSLDLLELNQYTGECHFYKNGAAASFLKRNGEIREIRADRLPLGISPQIEGYRETIFVQSQDMIVLASDGVLEVFYDNMDFFLSHLAGTDHMTPPQIASDLLRLAIRTGGGVISDDMTVLVLGICEKEDDPVAF